MVILLNKIIISTLLIIIIIYFICKNNNQFYKNIKDIKKPYKLDTLVNKNNRLSKYYRPYDLTKINETYSNKNKYLRRDACRHFELLSKDAKNKGFRIIAVSTYRSYFYQKELFNHYVKTKGLKNALIASAKAGHSEHQLGLSVDVEGSNFDYNKFEESKEFKWMINNAYKYGFILRYPKGKEHITGFKYEPWHFRYVGVKVAKFIHDKKITLEEYKKTR